MSANQGDKDLKGLVVVAAQRIEFNEYQQLIVRRIRAPGGWLTVTSCMLVGDREVAISVATTFVPDQAGIWLNESAQEVITTQEEQGAKP
ncbi:MAG: hypothetical protein ABI667_05180 [Sphingomicrobium sp.]